EAKAEFRDFIYSNRVAQLLADESYDTQWAPPPEPSGDQPASDDQPSLLIQRAVNGTWLGAQQFPPLEHAVDGIIPEGLGILVAPPKKGKSSLVGNVGLAVAAGGLALGAISVTRRPVLYLALEDGHRRLQSRFRHILDDDVIPEGIDVVIKASPKEALLMI